MASAADISTDRRHDRFEHGTVSNNQFIDSVQEQYF